MLLFAFMIGVCAWPALEYFLHRFFGHEWTLDTLFRREHQTHHRVRDFFAPAYLKALMAVLVLGSVYVIGRRLEFGFAVDVFVAGLLCNYLVYEWVHWSFHRYAPRTELGRVLRKHHFSHHFMNAKSNYGVTTRLFDRLFGTSDERGLVRVPKAITDCP